MSPAVSPVSITATGNWTPRGVNCPELRKVLIRSASNQYGRDMDPLYAREQLAHADELRADTARRGQWFARYLIVFGSASLVLGAFFAAFPDPGPQLLMPVMVIWIALVGGCAAWAARQKVALRGLTGLSIATFGTWGVVWGATCLVSSTLIKGRPWTWLVGAILMALVMFVGAAVVRRRTRR